MRAMILIIMTMTILAIAMTHFLVQEEILPIMLEVVPDPETEMVIKDKIVQTLEIIREITITEVIEDKVETKHREINPQVIDKINKIEINIAKDLVKIEIGEAMIDKTIELIENNETIEEVVHHLVVPLMMILQEMTPRIPALRTI